MSREGAERASNHAVRLQLSDGQDGYDMSYLSSVMVDKGLYCG